MNTPISLDDIDFLESNKIENHQMIFDDIDFSELNNVIKEKRNKMSKNELKKTFEWGLLDNIWLKKLLSNRFYKNECLIQENCTIENILITSDIIKTGLKQRIKKYLKEISFDEFSKIVNNYKLIHEQEYIGDININKITNRNSFIKEITNHNFILQCDDVTLYILSNILNIDFIILDDTLKEVIDKSENNNLNENIMLLYKEQIENDDNQKQYILKLIGIKDENNEIKYIFKRNETPKELNNILDRHTFLLSHVKNIFNDFKSNKKRIVIKDIMKDVKKNIHTQISDKELKNVMIILKNLIEQDMYKSL